MHSDPSLPYVHPTPRPLMTDEIPEYTLPLPRTKQRLHIDAVHSSAEHSGARRSMTRAKRSVLDVFSRNIANVVGDIGDIVSAVGDTVTAAVSDVAGSNSNNQMQTAASNTVAPATPLSFFLPPLAKRRGVLALTQYSCMDIFPHIAFAQLRFLVALAFSIYLGLTHVFQQDDVERWCKVMSGLLTLQKTPSKTVQM
ncbi:hypothetical protein BT96DRAFT_1004281 [Gymnopus androsaceus JB14]|uniref:Uncharacterized protein n=1 Tax=Gymnopus androsaceus JB14 TaxID=1447944 RepID=A0A6A4GSJ4_9AGAR|nr:hypothetical protein BT96DRAFT_1004281 [Gymnopus androsaceus JB14]